MQFMFEDAMASVAFFLAMQSGEWDLRKASMKSMAPVFTAFIHQTYQKIISMHLTDIHTMPSAIKTMFQQGALVVSIRE